MSSTANLPDLERGLQDVELDRIALSEGPAQARHGEYIEDGMNNPSRNDDRSQAPEGPHDLRHDFDSGANALWSLYEKEVESVDKVRIQALKDDMDGVLIFAGLFSAVITAFVVPKIQDLKVDLADQSVYYQRQSVEILAQISQQIASMGPQVSTNLTRPSPYPTFHSSAPDRLVAVCWLMSLVFSLWAALVATLVQQWARAYLRPLQRHDSLLKTLWIQILLSEGVDRLQMVAGGVPWLIHLSLILFFLGLSDAIMNINKFVGLATVVPISLCGLFYICGVIAPITNPQSPYRHPLSNVVSYLTQNLLPTLYNGIFRRGAVRPGRIVELEDQGHLAMELTAESKAQDVRAVRWLLDKINRSNKVETFVLAIPGTFDQDWSRNVWKAVVREAHPTPPLDVQGNLSLQEGNIVIDLCLRVRQLFETYNHQTESMKEAGRKRMQGCIETMACLVCCADVPQDWFGDVGEVLSEQGYNERINEPLTIRTNSSFAVRWTCLSLVAIRKMVMAKGNRVRELAGFAVSGIARFQMDYGAPDAAALRGAERIDHYLKTAWGHIEDLHRAFEPWGLNRTGEEIKNILRDFELPISELERIEVDADAMEDVDWRMSLLQDAMDKATHKLTRRLPGLSFHELKPAGPIMISEAFDFPLADVTPVTPQLIFPGQQLQALCTLGRRLRDIVEGRNSKKHKDILRSLEAIGRIPVPLRRLNHLMKRQLWRLQDLRDGDGFGFTVELFFLTLRQLSSASLSSESKREFYIGTFKVITSRWMDSRDSIGTQGILLDLLCDIVIQNRGVFSDFPYPAYIVDGLLELVNKMVDEQGDSSTHINDAVQELKDFNTGHGMDESFRDKALAAISPSQNAV